MATEMTEKQRLAVEALEGARREGRSLRAYAQSHGLAIQDLYNALAALRRKGLLAKPSRSAPAKFVSVRIEPGTGLSTTYQTPQRRQRTVPNRPSPGISDRVYTVAATEQAGVTDYERDGCCDLIGVSSRSPIRRLPRRSI